MAVRTREVLAKRENRRDSRFRHAAVPDILFSTELLKKTGLRSGIRKRRQTMFRLSEFLREIRDRLSRRPAPDLPVGRHLGSRSPLQPAMPALLLPYRPTWTSPATDDGRSVSRHGRRSRGPLAGPMILSGGEAVDPPRHFRYRARQGTRFFIRRCRPTARSSTRRRRAG